MTENAVDKPLLKSLWSYQSAHLFHPNLLPDLSKLILDQLLKQPTTNATTTKLIKGYQRKKLISVASIKRGKALINNLNSARPSRSSRVQLTLALANNVFVAGSTISGTLRISTGNMRPHIWSSHVHFGEISVNLIAAEISTGKNPRWQVLHDYKVPFQGYNLPPTAAVIGSSAFPGFWKAKSSTQTDFPFTIELPQDAPSEYFIGKKAVLRYVIVCSLKYMSASGHERLLIQTKPISVVEKFNALLQTMPPVRQTLHFEGQGKVKVKVTFGSPYFLAGVKASLDVSVRNNLDTSITLKKVGVLVEAVSKSSKKRFKNLVAYFDASEVCNAAECCFRKDEHRKVAVGFTFPESAHVAKHEKTLNDVSILLLLWFAIEASPNQKSFGKSAKASRIRVCRIPIHALHPASLFGYTGKMLASQSSFAGLLNSSLLDSSILHSDSESSFGSESCTGTAESQYLTDALHSQILVPNPLSVSITSTPTKFKSSAVYKGSPYQLHLFNRLYTGLSLDFAGKASPAYSSKSLASLRSSALPWSDDFAESSFSECRYSASPPVLTLAPNTSYSLHRDDRRVSETRVPANPSMSSSAGHDFCAAPNRPTCSQLKKMENLSITIPPRRDSLS